MTKKGAVLTAVAAGIFILSSFGAVSAKADRSIAVILDQAKQNGFTAAENAVPVTVSQPNPAPQAGPSVTITSFIMTGQNTPVAELCGRVAGGASEFTVVRVTVDPDTKHPGIYNALAGKDGAFCLAVVTYYGTANASASALNKGTSATATHGNPRD